MKKSTGTLYWGAGPLAESDPSASASSWKEYVFFNGKRVARRDASNSTVHYYFSDHLGSTTVIASSSGTPEQDLDYYPYGGTAYGTAADHYLFTGKERDTESGLDYFGARYYGSNMGRWMSPDWSGTATTVPYADFGDPQTLNLYGYVRNNPLSRVDADGHWGCKGSTEGFCNPAVHENMRKGMDSFSALGAAQSQAQEPGKMKNSPLVKANRPINVARSRAAATQEVDYFAVTPEGRAVGPHVMTLKEKFASEKHPNAKICDPACSNNEEGQPSELVRKGEFQDDQSVLNGSPYSVVRRWYVDGVPAKVLDPSNTPWDYEVNHNDTNATPPIQTEYKNDPN